MTLPSEASSLTWSSLIDYYLSCLKHEDSFEGFLQRSDTGSRYVFPSGRREQVFTAGESGLRVDPGIKSLIEAAALRGETLFYGYPVVLLEDISGGTTRRKLGCLMTIELAVPRAGETIPKVLFPKVDEPFFHPAVLSKFGVKAEQLSAIAEQFPPERAIGSPDEVSAYLSELVSALGMVSRGVLDPGKLDTHGEGEIDGLGAHNTAVVFRAAPSDYNRRLISELEHLRARGTEAAGTAAGLLISGRSAALATQAPPVGAICPIQSNDAQITALEAGLRDSLTVVTGPPGTGKSQLVANLIASAWASSQSVLLVSTNNQAVDVACARALAIQPGMVIRTGSKEHREKAKETLQRLISATTSLADKRAVLASLKASRQRLSDSRDAWDARTRAETRLAEVLLGQELLKATAKLAKSKVFGLLKGPSSAARWLRRVRRVREARWFRGWRSRRISESLGLDIQEYGDLAERFLELEVERQALKDTVQRCSEAQVLVREVIEAQSEFRKSSQGFIRWRVPTSILEGRIPIATFLQARVAAQHNGVAAAFPKVIPFLRAWASTALSVGATVPLTAGLFDLVVIDEASQCAIAQIIPVLFRAKRAVIIGDAQQLSHISTIGRNDEANKIRAAGLDAKTVHEFKLSHRQDSLFDLMAQRGGAEHTFLLDEHYRSHAQIIELSNELFNGASLTVLTDPKNLFDFGENAVSWENVDGLARRPNSGSAENPIEGAAVATAVVDLIRRQPNASVGVVTPFSAQARLIQSLLEAKLSPEIRQGASLIVGTAHKFQGDERDVIVFSPVASRGLTSRTLGWLGDTPNLFNVAITRARSHLLVIGNWTFCSEGMGPLAQLAQYIRALDVERSVAKAGQVGQLHSEAERRLYEAMLHAGLTIEPKALVRGYECDFVLRSGDAVINIECDGRHHVNASGRLRLQDRARDELIQNQGWRVIRIPAWRCLAEPEQTVAEIQSMLSSNGIVA